MLASHDPSAARRMSRAATAVICLTFLAPATDRAAAHCGSCPGDRRPASKHNTLTEQEVADGWELLFDGESLDEWRGYKMEEVPSGWVVEDGAIKRIGQEGWIDLITREQYDSFELKLEWKISEGGNSGIFFHVTEDYDHPWDSGPEMQVLDNGTYHDGQNTLTSAGANYGLHAPSEDVTRPVAEFNQVHLIVNGNHVEHYLNGHKIVAYELGTDEWEAMVAQTKFKDMPGYGRAGRGHIALQDHGDIVQYRNIKIRPLNQDEGGDETEGSSSQ